MTAPEAVRVAPEQALLEWLAAHGVDYELREHPLTITARETARAEGVDPRRFAKTIGVETADGRKALIAIEATERLDLVRARRVLASGDVRLLTEAELDQLAPDCDTGTLPPIGELFGVPVYADFSLREDSEITFHAGSHRFTVTVERDAWERATGVAYGALALTEGEPAWARS